MFKRIFCLLLTLSVFMSIGNLSVFASDAIETSLPEVHAKSAVLMEGATGKILYQYNEKERLAPASVTKIMTLLLIAEAIAEGRIAPTDEISISAHAASMGGSQVFLEEGERFTVEELLKCTVIASANDAAVALAEHHSGSEDAFIEAMNLRAKALGMENTRFENTTGLDDTVEEHLTSAEDIAIMSRELLRYDCIRKYSCLWQDSIRDGAFVLTNTNRLVRYYPGCTGLKTGSTDKAGFCISASAERDGMELIVVVMGAETRDERNNIARQLLDYGFASFSLYRDAQGYLEDAPCVRSTALSVPLYTKGLCAVVAKGDAKRIEKTYEIPEKVIAPMSEGEVVGSVIYTLEGEEIGRCDVTVGANVDRVAYADLFWNLILQLITGKSR